LKGDCSSRLKISQKSGSKYHCASQKPISFPKDWYMVKGCHYRLYFCRNKYQPASCVILSRILRVSDQNLMT